MFQWNNPMLPFMAEWLQVILHIDSPFHTKDLIYEANSWYQLSLVKISMISDDQNAST